MLSMGAQPRSNYASHESNGKGRDTMIIKDSILRFLQDEVGATAIEYGLIAALIAVGIIVAAQALGTQISTTFNNVAANMK
jgi:pilus assembly protein Flp/PilA